MRKVTFFGPMLVILAACGGGSPNGSSPTAPVTPTPTNPTGTNNGGTSAAPAELPAPSNVACRDRQARLDAGLGFCFDAEFNTTHDNVKIDMTVYVPHPDNLANASGATLADGELGYAPLVIHGHGFGGSKEDDFENNRGHFVDSQTALTLWNAGYFVISFSERGFGQSGGQIGFMAPDGEGQDINELLDWAVKHLRGESSTGAADSIYQFDFTTANTEHTSSVLDGSDNRPSLLMNDSNTRMQIGFAGNLGDPSVGTVGYSYGGGFQYTASHADTDDVSPRIEQERFDALIPEGTWHDLRYSLHSNDTPKGYWATLLFSFAINGGTLSNGQPTPQFLTDVYTEAVINGRVSAANQNFLGANSSSFYCDPTLGTTTNASLLHIQGVRDTLFDFNDGYNNVKCFADAGLDARYLAVSGGHPLTVSTQPIYTGQRTSMDIDEIFHCDSDGDGVQERFTTRILMFNWFEEKLRGQAGAADGIPNVCIAQENTVPGDLLVDPNYNGSNASFNYLKEGLVYDSLNDILIGAGSAPAYSCDNDTDATCEIDQIVTLAAIDAMDPNAALQAIGFPAPIPGVTEVTQSIPVDPEVFVPLVSINESRIMAGIPTVDLQLSVGLDGPTGFQASPAQPPYFILVGTGLQRDGNTVILHDQIMPIRDTAEYPYQDTAGVTTENGINISYGCGIDFEAATPADVCDRGRLVGVTTRLLPGDVVGLVFKPADVQYQQLVNTPAQLRITGDVQFPILAPSLLPAANHPQ